MLLKAKAQVAVIATILGSQAACAAMTRNLASEGMTSAVGGAVEGGAEALSSSAVQRDLSQLLSDRELQAAVAGMTGSLVGGAVDPLTEGERAARLRVFAASFIDALGRASARVLERDLSPAMAAAAAAAVDGVMTRALAEGHQEEVGELTRRLIRATAEGMAAGLREDLYPAMGATFGSDGFAGAMGLVGFEFSRGVVRGSETAMQEIAERKKVNQEPEGLISWMSGATMQGVTVGIVMAVAMAITLVVAVILLVRASRERQRLELGASRREMALMALITELSARVGVDVKGRLAELEAENVGLGEQR